MKIALDTRLAESFRQPHRPCRQGHENMNAVNFGQAFIEKSKKERWNINEMSEIIVNIEGRGPILPKSGEFFDCLKTSG